MDSVPSPFLSIVTRCFKRPSLLERNKESVYNQLDQDWEHIFIVDDIGMGMEAANKALALNKHLISGEYVFILDDDDILVLPVSQSGVRSGLPTLSHLAQSAVVTSTSSQPSGTQGVHSIGGSK